MCVKNKMTSNGPMRVPPAHMGYSSNIGPILVPFGHFAQILPIWHPLLAGFILSLKVLRDKSEFLTFLWPFFILIFTNFGK